MAGQLAGGLLNIVLDPLFIYTLGMGIRGAGAATALSQVMVWAALLWFYVRGKTSVRISVRQVARTPRMVKLIFTTLRAFTNGKTLTLPGLLYTSRWHRNTK